MTPAIQLLLIQIMQLGALLAADPGFVVFTSTSGQTHKIAVEIFPAGSVWREGVPTPAAIAYADVRWEPYRSPFDDDEMYAAELLRTQHKLEFMRAALHGYLPSDPVEVEEPSETDAPPIPFETVIDDDGLAAVQRLALNGGKAELRLFTGPLEHSALLQVDRIDLPNGYVLEAALAIHKQRHTLSLGLANGNYMHRLCEWVESIAHGRLANAA